MEAEAEQPSEPPELQQRRAARREAERRAGAVRTLWAAAHRQNRRYARRSSSTAAGGRTTGWRGGQSLRAGRQKVRSLCAHEFGIFTSSVLFNKPRLAKRLFELLNGDGDENLSADEWRAAFELLCDPARGAERTAFLFRLVDPGGPGQRCQYQVTGRRGRQIDEASVEYFFERFLVLADDTVDIVLASVERYFGLAPSTTQKRGDGKMVVAAHHGMLGTNRPTAPAVGLRDPGNQGRADVQGLEHADYFRPTDKCVKRRSCRLSQQSKHGAAAQAAGAGPRPHAARPAQGSVPRGVRRDD